MSGRKYAMYEVVRLRKRIPGQDLEPGATGTILIIHKAQPPAYEGEFIDEQGNSLGVVTLTGEYLDAAKK